MREARTTRALILFAFLMTSYSLIALGLCPPVSLAPYSIVNTGNFGLSDFKALLEREGFRVLRITSSLQALAKVEQPAVVCIIGPALDFTHDEAIALMTFLARGGAVLIADDFGRANSLLEQIWLALRHVWAQQGTQLLGLYFNSTAVLMDAGSFYRTPAQPILKVVDERISGGREMRVLTSFPTAIMIEVKLQDGRVVSLPLPGDVGLLSSTEYSWLETDLSAAKRGTAEPDRSEWGGVPMAAGLLLEFTAERTIRLALVGDPDIFTNALLRNPRFQNAEFALSLIKYLARGLGTNLVIFDESHLPRAPFEPLFWVALWLRPLLWLSATWYMAPVIPILLISTLFGFVGGATTVKIPTLRHEVRVLASPFRDRLRLFLSRREFLTAVSLYVNWLASELRKILGVEREELIEVFEEAFRRRPDLSKYEPEVMPLVRWLLRAREARMQISERDFIRAMRILRRFYEAAVLGRA